MIVVRNHKMTTSLKSLRDQLRTLSTRTALVTMAETYGMHAKSFVFDGQLYSVASALKEIPEYLLDMNCDQFGAVRFFGGPPKKGNWFTGSIMTMLCDAVLFDENTRHLDSSQRLTA